MNMNMEPVKILYPHSLGNYIILKIGERYLEQANILQEKLQNCSCQFTDNTRFVPRINQTVAIYSAQNRKWNRAQVLKVNCEERECLVRYLEVATTDTVTFLSMHPVPRDISVEAIPPQSIQITLADVCPVMVNFLGEVQPGSQWTHLSLDEIREYFGKHRGFFYEHKYTIQGFHFGNLHVRRSNGSVDLANELVQSGHALRYQNWLDQTRRLPPIALEHLTGGLKMCSREMLMKLKESRRVHTRSSSVSSDDRLARSSHRPTTGQPRTSQPQESVVSSTTDQVRGDPSARSAGDTPLSRRSRSLIRSRDAGPGTRGSEGGVGSEGGAGSVQRDGGRRDEPIRWTDGEPTGRSENGITSPPALAPHVMEALASVEPHPGRRKSRLTLLLEKVKAKKAGGGVTHGSNDERNVSTSPLQNGTGAVHHNGDLPHGGTAIGGMANGVTPNTKQTTDRTTPVTCPATSGQSLSQGARNLMNRMTKSAGQISPGYNVTAVNTNRLSLPQRETAGGIAPCNATQSTISQPSAGERTSFNSTQSPISPQLSDGGMTSTDVTQSPVSPNNSPVSPQSDGRNSRRLSRRDIFRKVQKMKTKSVSNPSASAISASAVDNAGPVCPQSTISGSYPVRNADFRTDTVCHTNLNDGSPNRSLNVSSADSSLNVSYTDLSVNGSYTDSSVNVISTDSNVNVTLKSAVSRGRSQSRARSVKFNLPNEN